MLTRTQTQVAQAIVNIFETSSVRGDYGKVTLIPGDTGHLTFGRSQTTLGSGNLHKLIDLYCQRPGALFGPRLSPYLPGLEQTDRFSAIESCRRRQRQQVGDRLFEHAGGLIWPWTTTGTSRTCFGPVRTTR